MKNSETNEVLALRKATREYTLSLPYNEKDVRLEYFEFMLSIIDRFHTGHANMELLDEIVQKKLLKDLILNSEHYRLLLDNRLDEKGFHSYFQDLNRQFIIDSWSVFELTITKILDSVLDATSRDEFLNKEYNQVKKILDSEILSESNKKMIFRLLKEGRFLKNHITHQSINRRYEKLFDIFQFDRLKIKEYKQFLEFLGKYRNSLHYNFIYSGQSFEYEFKDLKFSFIDQKPIQVPNKPWTIEIISGLIDICKNIFKCIDIEFIESKESYAT
jgi:hypothetical protein